MPYEGEFAQYKSLRRLAESGKVKELLGEYEFRAVTDNSTALDKVPIEGLPPSQWQPDWVLAVDGSHHEVQVKNGFPGAEASYLTIASVLLDVKKIRELDQQRPVDPKVFRTTEQAESIDWAFPGCNVITKGETSAKHSLRKRLFDVFEAKRMSEERESLLDTFEVLLAHKPDDQRSQICPYAEDCPIENAEYQRNKGKYKCHCEKKLTLYSTDALRIHEGMNPAGTNGALFGEIMQVLERVWVVHILRTMEQQKWLPSLRKLAIVVDGPLAVFGHPAWLSHAIFKELVRLNDAVRAATNGQDILLIGIEKTGQFAEHFSQIDTNEKGEIGQFPKGAVGLLTNSYINQNIIFSDSQRFYGRQSYFGRKLFYKTSSGARIVATLPFLAEEHKDLNNAEVKQFPRLADAVRLLDQLVSSRYPNALSPVVAANAEAAIPLNLGKKVLERLAKELISQGHS